MTFDSLPSADFDVSTSQAISHPIEAALLRPRITKVKRGEAKERTRKMFWPGQVGPGDLTLVAAPPGRERMVLVAELAMTHARGRRLPDGCVARACKVTISTTPELAPLYASLIDPNCLDDESIVIHAAPSLTYGMDNDLAHASVTDRVSEADAGASKILFLDLPHQPLENGAGRSAAILDSKSAMDVTRASGMGVYAVCTSNDRAPAKDVLRGLSGARCWLDHATTCLALIEPHYAHADNSLALVRLRSTAGSRSGAFRFKVEELPATEYGTCARISWGETLPGDGREIARILREAPPKAAKTDVGATKTFTADAAPAKSKDKAAATSSRRRKAEVAISNLSSVSEPIVPAVASDGEHQAQDVQDATPSHLLAQSDPQSQPHSQDHWQQHSKSLVPDIAQPHSTRDFDSVRFDSPVSGIVNQDDAGVLETASAEAPPYDAERSNDDLLEGLEADLSATIPGQAQWASLTQAT